MPCQESDKTDISFRSMLMGLSVIWCSNGSGGELSLNNNLGILTEIVFLSGSITNVRQIGIEFHKVPQNVKIYFTIIQELYKLGFVTIAWDPNLTTKPAKGPFQYFEIVFRRSYVEDCED